MLELILRFLTWTFGLMVAALVLVGKTYLEQISKLHAQDWYANYRSKIKE